MSLAVVILAAGKGTRLNSEKYKVFHEIGIFNALSYYKYCKATKS